MRLHGDRPQRAETPAPRGLARVSAVGRALNERARRCNEPFIANCFSY
jgi:hypothetical protein